MQILARIPVLPTVAEPMERRAGPQPTAGDHDAERAGNRPGLEEAGTGMVAATAIAGPVVEDQDAERLPEEPVVAVGCPESRPRPAEPMRSSWLPTPSILVLAFLAVAMWVAALRNDRLRLDAARQARAERMAQVIPDAVDPRGSRTR